jgi:hypothetical protein
LNFLLANRTQIVENIICTPLYLGTVDH